MATNFPIIQSHLHSFSAYPIRCINFYNIVNQSDYNMSKCLEVMLFYLPKIYVREFPIHVIQVGKAFQQVYKESRSDCSEYCTVLTIMIVSWLDT